MTPRLLVRILCLSALVGASLLVAAPSATLAVNTTPRFNISLGDCWRGQVPEENVRVHVVWEDSAGHLVDRFTVRSFEYGYWQFPDNDITCDSRPVRAGDRLTQTELDGQKYTRSFVVKPMDGRFDRRTNLVTGHVPTGSLFYLSVFQEDLIGIYGAPVCDEQPTRAADGSFSFDTSSCGSGYNASGGDQAWLTWSGAKGDRETIVATAPFAQVRFGSALVTGYSFAGTQIATTLKSSTGTVRATGENKSAVDGSWKLNDKNNVGNFVTPKVGDVISGNWATGSASITVFGMTTAFGANTVRGTCTPNTRYSLIVLWTGTTFGSRTNGMTDGAGSTGDYTPDSHTLAPGDRILFTCAKPNGDRERQVTVYQ